MSRDTGGMSVLPGSGEPAAHEEFGSRIGFGHVPLRPHCGYHPVVAMELSRTTSVILAGIDSQLHVGAGLYVWHGGQTVADWAAGIARPASAEAPALPMTPDTIIAWLSAGKPITAVAIAQLWEQGRLDLDDPVARHIPEFAQHDKGAITLRHLLTHTAPLRLVDTGWPAAPWDEIIARIASARPEPRWVAGHTAGYGAHAGWFVLGEIAARLSGMAVADYVRRQVLAPCGMVASFMSMTVEEQQAMRERMAVMQQTEPWKKNQLDFEAPAAIAAARPGASMRGPVRELGLFYRMLLNRGLPADSAGPRILQPQTIEALTARHRVGLHDKTFGTKIDWGLGFLLNSNHYGAVAPYQYGSRAGLRTFGHSGNQSSAAFCDPDAGLVAAVAFNGWPGEAAHQQRIRAVLDALYDDLGL